MFLRIKLEQNPIEIIERMKNEEMEAAAKNNRHMTDMTAGKILPILLSFAVPLMIGNLFSDLYNIADKFIAGHTVGDTALAAISATSGIMSFIYATARGFNIGNSVSVSNAFGEGNMEKTRKSLAGMFVLTYTLTVSLTILLCIFIKPLMRLVNTPDHLFHDAYLYIIVINLGISFTMTYEMSACAFRALGNSRIPLILLIISSVLNVILDWIFMGPLKLGVMGAAAATILAQIICSAFSLTMFYRMYPELHFLKSDFTGIFPIVKEMFPLGISGAFTNSMCAVGWIFMQAPLNSLGQDTLVAYSAYKTILSFAVIPSVSIANTLSTFSAQNYGAHKFGRITKGILVGCFFSLLINVVSFSVIFLFGKDLVQWVTNTKSAIVLEQANSLLLVNVSFIWAQTVIMGFRYSIQGMRKKLIPWLGTCFEMAMRIVFALVFVPLYGYIAVGLAESACWLFGGIMMVICYFVILKKEKNP